MKTVVCTSFLVGLFVVFGLSFSGCKTKSDEPAAMEFILNDSTRAVFSISENPEGWVLHNGGEPLLLPRVNDSLLRVPVFNGTIDIEGGQRATWTDALRPIKDGEPYQVSIELSDDYSVPLSTTVSGTWDVWFEGDDASVSTTQLDLQTSNDQVFGTFRTPTGDYRFFNGTFDGTRLKMQTFDGAHLYVITAKMEENQWVSGLFYSGNHYVTGWYGRVGDPWPQVDAVEAIRVPIDSLFATTIDREGRTEKTPLIPEEGEVLVLDVLGSWCPNCMDEVRLLKELGSPEVSIRSIAFERFESTNDAYRRIDEFKSEMGIEWPILLGGTANKEVAADAFPFLEKIISFPTTLFIHPGGEVFVHSGFNGPATGSHYLFEKTLFETYTQPRITSQENR